MAKYRVPTLENFSFQPPVEDKDLTTSPSGSTKGLRHIIAGTGGDWSGGTINDIAWFDGADWQFDTPLEGWLTYVKDENEFYFFTGSAWEMLPTNAGDMLKSVYDTDNDGIVDKAETIDDGVGNSATAADVKDAVDKKHTQNTDTKLDEGGDNEISAAQAKDAYDKRAVYDSDLGVLFFDNQ